MGQAQTLLGRIGISWAKLGVNGPIVYSRVSVKKISGTVLFLIKAAVANGKQRGFYEKIIA